MQASSLAICRANNLSPKQSGTGAWGLLTLIIIIIIRAIIKAYSPSCWPWMCPWLGILIARRPADTSLPPGEKFRCRAGIGPIPPCLASPPQRERFFPLITSPRSGMLAQHSEQSPSRIPATDWYR